MSDPDDDFDIMIDLEMEKEESADPAEGEPGYLILSDRHGVRRRVAIDGRREQPDPPALAKQED
jgi:hypothetical protein